MQNLAPGRAGRAGGQSAGQFRRPLPVAGAPRGRPGRRLHLELRIDAINKVLLSR